PMEAFESGTLALISVKEGEKVPVGGLMGVIAKSGENVEEIKKSYAGKKTASSPAPASAAKTPTTSPSGQEPRGSIRPGSSQAAGGTSTPAAPKPTPARTPPPASKKSYDFDIVVIGGGPAGYAAAIRAGQLKKRVLCVERENLGGTCLKWGCIPSKALLEDGQFIRQLRTEAADRGVTIGEVSVDFAKIIGRSRTIADKLAKGIAHLFRKYEVKHEMASGQLLGPHRVKVTTKEGGSREVS